MIIATFMYGLFTCVMWMVVLGVLGTAVYFAFRWVREFLAVCAERRVYNRACAVARQPRMVVMDEYVDYNGLYLVSNGR